MATFYDIFNYLRKSSVGFLESIRKSVYFVSEGTPNQFEKAPSEIFTLPKVVCIGTQSSGKSSLISRIVLRKIFPAVSKLFYIPLSDS